VSEHARLGFAKSTVQLNSISQQTNVKKMRTNSSSKSAKFVKLALGGVACIGASVVAYAAVTFDPANGHGQVGKGDLQTPWGWNDAKLQSCGSGVRFYYHTEQSATYSAVCEFTTGEGTRGEKTHLVTHTIDRVNSVNSTVTYDTRKNNLGKITGFMLTGLGSSSTVVATGEIPVVGGPCPGNAGHDGTWSSVQLLSSTAGTGGGGLYAASDAAPVGGSPLLIWSAPTL
jgi:hypothetical protein